MQQHEILNDAMDAKLASQLHASTLYYKVRDMIDLDDPFVKPSKRWIPPEMVQAPTLDALEPRSPVQSRYALLINPFYPKDPHASFGKHVLTPTLALTSIAATTPEHWRGRLLGREPAPRAARRIARCRRSSASPST